MIAGLQFNIPNVKTINKWLPSFQSCRTVDYCNRDLNQSTSSLNPYFKVLSKASIDAVQALTALVKTDTRLVQGVAVFNYRAVPESLYRTNEVENATTNIREDDTVEPESDDQSLDFSKVKKDYRVPKYPIVLCHGFSGFDTLIYIPAVKFSIDMSPFKSETEKKQKKDDALYQEMERGKQEIDRENKLKPKDDSEDENEGGVALFEYWHGIKETLEEHGCRVLVAKVPPFAAIETRAGALNKFIADKVTKWQNKHHTNEKVKINLVAHSMGGLDCRYLISKLEKKNYEIMSLTTISTPHRGTYAADFATKYAPKAAIDNYFPSLRQMTREYSRKMNWELLNDPKVQYFSFGGSAHLNPSDMYYIPWYVIGQKEGPNDGMVSLRSCKWGKYMGHIEGVDHKDLINWMGGVNRIKQAVGAEVDFNPLAFYLSIADNLARNGL